MRTAWKLLASLVSITALALMAATTLSAANPNAVYTCIKVKNNGEEDVRVGVPEAAVSGLTNAGFTCVATVPEDEDEEEGEEEEQGEEEQGEEEQGDSGSAPANVSSVAYVAEESRSIYCSMNGPAHRANGDGMGIALNLTETQGALMVEMGLVKPANFYQGIGASCDLLSGFTYSGVWVDHVGDVVPGVVVYPLFTE
jgi:hypothetical protein